MKLFQSFSETIFFTLAFNVIIGSLGVVLLTDIVYSAFLLGFVFACVALLYLLLDADFVAAAQILIYVGAINVLIVFAVMLINKKKFDNFFLFWTIGDGIASVICISIFLVLNNTISTISWSKIYLFIEGTKNDKLILTDNIRRIGSGFLTEFIVPFELMSIILLIALIGAIVLARGEQLINPIENPLEKKK